jgi:hypothetical protein
MDAGPQVETVSGKPGRFTLACRFICTALVAAPLLYYNLVTNGSAYYLLALVLLAPIAGIVLVANSLFCLIRYRNVESYWIGLAFVLVGVTGILETWYFLPQFRVG